MPDDAPDQVHEGPMAFAGIELGGTKCVAILGSGPGAIVDRLQVPTTSPAETLGMLAGRVRDWARDRPVGGVGIASFGPIDLEPRSSTYGQILATPKPGWHGADVAEPFRSAGIPVAIDTDVNGAALAEGRWGGAVGLRSYAYITVGTGVGVGSVMNGATMKGIGHSEAGHQRVPRLPGDDWPGACPFHGDCVEGLASGAAIRDAFKKGAGVPPRSWEGWARVVDALAMLLHNLVLTTVPQRILIGGGVMNGEPWLLDAVRDRLTTSLSRYAHGALVSADADYLAPPMLGSDAGPLGAICMASRVQPDPPLS